MTEFKSLEVYDYPRVGDKVTDDNLYWKKLGFPTAFKEYGAIDYIDFCSQEPYNMAATCSSKVQLYNATSDSPLASFSRFKKTAYGGVFRKDGKLLVAGSEDGFLRLFEVQGTRLLRMFKGHKAATHRCDFTADGVHLVSFSDDKTIALWDIVTETQLKLFSEHKDYVRAAAVSPSSQDLFLSGSYDHTIKLFDVRTGKSVLSVDHGVPVEALLMFPMGGIFISAGGNSVKVWDPVAGRCLAEVVQHHKTVTCLCFASEGKRVMSGSLDRHVKVYDVMSYEVVHTFHYPSPILSVSAAAEDKALAVGMVDGLLSLRSRREEKSKTPASAKKKRSPFYQYKLYGTDFKPPEGDIVIHSLPKKSYKKYEMHLRNFESSKALDVVLLDYVQKSSPETTISVLMELMRRGSVRAAMAGREGDSLLPLLKFVTRYITSPRFTRVLIDVGLILIELYGPKMADPEVQKMFKHMLDAVEGQYLYLREMMQVQGVLQTILTAKNSPHSDEEDLPTFSGMVGRIS